MNIDDPKLTAYALDELSGEEKTRVGLEVADSAEAQGFVAGAPSSAAPPSALAKTEVEGTIAAGSSVPSAEEVGPNSVNTYRTQDISRLAVRGKKTQPSADSKTRINESQPKVAAAGTAGRTSAQRFDKIAQGSGVVSSLSVPQQLAPGDLPIGGIESYGGLREPSDQF